MGSSGRLVDFREAQGPLKGVRVLDASTILAGPLSAAILGDFGAEVIKVEQPGHGDPVRRFPPSVEGQAVSSKVTNRNKRSVAIDLHHEAAREVFLRLVAKSDVVIVNYRPATLTKWGIDYQDLVAVRPDVVMMHLTGFGRTGPYSEKPGFARIAEAYAGLTYITGFPDGPPMFAGYAIGDGLAGVYGALSVMLALYERRDSGKGQLIDLALYEPTLRILENLVVTYSVTNRVAERVGNLNKSVAPSDIYHLADGNWVAIPSSTPNMYSRLCQAVGRPDLIHDERFSDNTRRVENQPELDAELRPAIERFRSDELLALLERVGVAAGPVNSVADLVADPHVWERGSLEQIFDPNLGRDVVMQSVFPMLSRTPGSVQFPGREPGQDTHYVLKQVLGMAEPEIERLIGIGAVGTNGVSSERSAS